jgi:hypothetical protein
MTNDVTVPQPDGAAAAEVTATPGDALRALPAEAEQRGSRFVSAQAMQARLFSVYDAASAAEDALSLVQSQLTLTLNRSYYDADEVEAMASQLDALLMLDAAERIEDGAPAGEADLASVGPEE